MAFVWKLSRDSYKYHENNLIKLIKTGDQLYYSGIINRYRIDARAMWQISKANIN